MQTLREQLFRLLAIAVAVAVVLLTQSRLVAVTVSGADSCAEEVRAVLSQCGASIGASRYAVDTVQIQQAVEAIEGVSTAVVRLTGARLSVSVRTLTQATDLTEETEAGVVRARYDAIVTGISVVSGVAVVKVGDVVTKGDVLIRAGDPIDPELTLTPRGIVYGEVWSCATQAVYPERTVTEKTGRMQVRRTLCWNGTTLLSDRRGIPFARYEQRTQVDSVAGGRFLPLRLVTQTFLETQERTVAVDLAAERPLIETELIRSARSRLGADCTEKDSYCIATAERDHVRITAVVKATAIISVAGTLQE